MKKILFIALAITALWGEVKIVSETPVKEYTRIALKGTYQFNDTDTNIIARRNIEIQTKNLLAKKYGEYIENKTNIYSSNDLQTANTVTQVITPALLAYVIKKETKKGNIGHYDIEVMLDKNGIKKYLAGDDTNIQKRYIPTIPSKQTINAGMESEAYLLRTKNKETKEQKEFREAQRVPWFSSIYTKGMTITRKVINSETKMVKIKKSDLSTIAGIPFTMHYDKEELADVTTVRTSFVMSDEANMELMRFYTIEERTTTNRLVWGVLTLGFSELLTPRLRVSGGDWKHFSTYPLKATIYCTHTNTYLPDINGMDSNTLVFLTQYGEKKVRLDRDCISFDLVEEIVNFDETQVTQFVDIIENKDLKDNRNRS